MKPNITASQLGLPFLKGPVRFAVGPPDGLTSNAWRIWTSKHGDVYIACRDNFKETKVSLHTSGRWRMGFTTEAINENPRLLPSGADRVWEVWDEPPEALPDTVVAFRLIFPASELVVRPEQRAGKLWKTVLYIESAPVGKVTTVTLFVTKGSPRLKHESEPSICLASFNIGNDRSVQIITHTDPANNIDKLLEMAVREASKQAVSSGISVPYEGYCYFFGKHEKGWEKGCRFIIGARAHRET